MDEEAAISDERLGQLMGKGAKHAYKVVLINGTKSADLDLEVSLLPVEGKGRMRGGLIWHATDDRNYYLARANPLEQNVRVYRVVKGVRQMLRNSTRSLTFGPDIPIHVCVCASVWLTPSCTITGLPTLLISTIPSGYDSFPAGFSQYDEAVTTAVKELEERS